MNSTKHLEYLVNLYLKQGYTLYKPQNEFGEEITQKITFISRADFQLHYLNFYRTLPSLEQVIIYSCRAKFKIIYDGHEYELKHSHQAEFIELGGVKHGVDNGTLQLMIDNIMPKQRELVCANSFDDVYNIIKESKVIKFGELAIYDTAIRISAYLGFSPSMIYLHAGTRIGAINLEEKGLLKKGASSQEKLPVSEFPKPIQKLEPTQIENFLCSFKKALKK
ncbi:MAG: hypothetical protein ACRC5D_19045 [Aeromonas allosaccharophila]